MVVLALWFAAHDLTGCLTWIASWLTSPDDAREPAVPAGVDGAEPDDSGPSPKQVLAAAAAAALIRLHTAHTPDGTGVARAPTLLFEVLAEPLAQQGDDGVELTLRLVEHWLEDPIWAGYLAGEVREGRGRLERWTAEFLFDRPELTRRLLERLDACRSDGELNARWTALKAVIDRLQALRALEHPASLPDLESDQHYVLVVLDTSATGEALRRHLTAVAVELYRELATKPGIVPAICRMGERAPFWAGIAESPSEERLVPEHLRLAGLIGPLLQALQPNIDHVSTVLVVAGMSPIDLDDWVDSRWWSRIRLYGDGHPPTTASFPTLPAPLRFTTPLSSPSRFEAGRLGDYIAGLPREERIGVNDEPSTPIS